MGCQASILPTEPLPEHPVGLVWLSTESHCAALPCLRMMVVVLCFLEFRPCSLHEPPWLPCAPAWSLRSFPGVTLFMFPKEGKPLYVCSEALPEAWVPYSVLRPCLTLSFLSKVIQALSFQRGSRLLWIRPSLSHAEPSLALPTLL